MVFGEHVTMTMRHHRIDRLSGPDLLPADDDGDFDLPAAQIFDGVLQLAALPRTGRVRENGFVYGGRNLGWCHAGKCNRGTPGCSGGDNDDRSPHTNRARSPHGERFGPRATLLSRRSGV